MKFEWDENKNRLNKAKHGVSFNVAARVFADPDRLERYDQAHSADEDRWITIGMVSPVVLMVVYTEREGQKTLRLISARQANEQEQKAYYHI
ncbi:BrnT family toxin [Desulfovibrio sp. OttesenSCG-928-M14]|nr:BrnT family toxin [Desulfovibrio sp. OttesenSCG-928-M14]